MKCAPWTARLYPERGSSLFVRVQVWPTHKAFLRYVNANLVAADGRRFGSRCHGTAGRYEAYRFKKGRPQRRDPCVAEVNLWRGKLTMNVVTHELFHATISWGYRVRFPFGQLASADVTKVEERMTYAHGNLCSRFVARAYAAGLYDDRNTMKAGR